MSKLSPSLKSLINASFARPGQTPAPAGIADVYRRIASEAKERKYGNRPWLTLSAAATFTLNSPASLSALHQVATSDPSGPISPLAGAELIREVGLKCISFNGIPRSINCLGAFRSDLLARYSGSDWLSKLETKPSRALDRACIDGVNRRGRELWKSVYTPLDEKLEAKLADSHPDLPVYILAGHYGPLLSNPRRDGSGLEDVGRTLTSIVAISCLRAQTGVGPQVLSHVFGLRKGVEQGAHRTEFLGLQEGSVEEEEADGVERLATDEGCEWILNSVDSIAQAIGGSNFAQRQPRESKL
ncbi:hypothetical protein QBC46DRAFT_394062 [Diplogelasinospora grovesii]|uniref:Dol-P-Man:Man(5)GlcNAc(2)-PP-Dol alpha-1,3-mannosyltransferase n=1 Tax=Diplogelasinospora grovesii TaxID=303347 RepID=A0AAN6S0N7_9PEZI|nr:hypothetical protein QBC46DRAFT_394062 [Diplogelasinospora grovesii]